MALNASRLQTAIYNAMVANLSPTVTSAAVLANLQEIAQSIASAVVTEITANASVSVTASVVSSVVAPSGGGPCTGTLSSTGTVT